VTGTVDGAVGHPAAVRDQLASFRPLLALSMVMTSSRDETEDSAYRHDGHPVAGWVPGRGRTEPAPHHQFLLTMLVHQTGVARRSPWNTVLTLELAHLQALGEVELRLRRDLVEELPDRCGGTVHRATRVHAMRQHP